MLLELEKEEKQKLFKLLVYKLILKTKIAYLYEKENPNNYSYNNFINKLSDILNDA